jgi:hypothetical protein
LVMMLFVGEGAMFRWAVSSACRKSSSIFKEN